MHITTDIMIASFFSGIACATFAASGVFFLKFWRASRDSFFLAFGVACWLLALERIAGIAFEESGIWSYIVRLAAFVVIFVAFLRKNQTKRSDSA